MTAFSFAAGSCLNCDVKECSNDDYQGIDCQREKDEIIYRLANLIARINKGCLTGHAVWDYQDNHLVENNDSVLHFVLISSRMHQVN